MYFGYIVFEVRVIVVSGFGVSRVGARKVEIV